MPEVTITVGGRDFRVVCQDGEEHYLQTAAAMLDTEAQALLSQIGRMPEARMLLMAGLMLADRTAAFEEQAKAAEARVAQLEAEVAALQSAPAPEPKTVEVPVVPPAIVETMKEMAARAEALADLAEERLKT